MEKTLKELYVLCPTMNPVCDMECSTCPDLQESTREHLQDLLAMDEGLNDWEVGFLDNIASQDYQFQPKQIGKVFEIYGEKL